MAKPPRVALADLMAQEEGQGSAAPAPVSAPVTDAPAPVLSVVPSQAASATIAPQPPKQVTAKPPAKYNVARDSERVGLYLHPVVAKEIKFVAFSHDRKDHDIYMEAIDMVLKKYGRPSIRELSTKVK